MSGRALVHLGVVEDEVLEVDEFPLTRSAATASYWEARISIEVMIDDALTDIVAERFDAGIRFGGLVEKDMIARRVGPDVVAAVVASPAYGASHGRPGVPEDLTGDKCIN